MASQCEVECLIIVHDAFHLKLTPPYSSHEIIKEEMKSMKSKSVLAHFMVNFLLSCGYGAFEILRERSLKRNANLNLKVCEVIFDKTRAKFEKRQLGKGK